MSKLAELKIPVFQSDDPRVTVGRYTYGVPALKIWSADEKISIGSFCSISEQVTIFAGGEHNTDWVSTYPFRVALDDQGAYRDGHPATKGETIIGNDVWIGFGVTILSGVQVGNGAVLGACSVVTKDVPPYAIVAGNPAAIIRYRFSEEVISALQSIRWWDWDEKEILSSVDILCSDKLEEFVDRYLK